MEDVEIRIYDIKGSVMSAIQLTDTGDGKLAVDSNTLATGTFVYTLSVRGKIIDSKVMIITE